jgi:hypothetical protein
MIGSFWLHYFGKFTGEDGSCIPFGEMDDANAKVIADNGPDRIVVFDQDPQKVERAVAAILGKNLPYAVTLQQQLVPSSDVRRTLRVAILERSRSSPRISPAAKFSWHQMHRGRLISSNGNESEFLSSRIKWWDPLAEADLGSLRKGDRIKIPYMVHSGRIRFGIGKRGKEPSIKVEKWPSDHESKLELIATEDMNDAVISLRNRYPTGSSSRIRVGNVLLFKNVVAP